MDINISVPEGILEGPDKAVFEKYLNDRFEGLGNFLRHYIKRDAEIDVKLSKVGSAFSLSYTLKGKKPVYVHRKGADLFEVAGLLIEDFKSRISQELGKARKDALSRKRARQRVRLEDALPDLARHKEEEDWEAFSHLFRTMIPELRYFLERRYHEETRGRESDEHDLNLQELIDDLYLDIWRYFDKRPAENQQIKEWIYNMADQFIVNLLKQHEEISGDITVDELSRQETDAFDETFTWDAEGERYLEEEFVDPTDILTRYRFNDFFPDEVVYDQYQIEDYNEFVEEFNDRVIKELAQFPIEKRTTFDYYFNEGFSVGEISRIRNLPEKEVKRTLKEIIDHLKSNLKAWLDQHYTALES
ncbi:MAG: sigma-70 family RNA polymerase sigma factor [Marinilabilia sp.]